MASFIGPIKMSSSTPDRVAKGVVKWIGVTKAWCQVHWAFYLAFKGRISTTDPAVEKKNFREGGFLGTFKSAGKKRAVNLALNGFSLGGEG